MTAYELGRALGMEKEAGIWSWVPKAGRRVLRWLSGGGPRRLASTPIGRGSRAAVAEMPAATRPLLGPTGRSVAGGAAFLGGMTAAQQGYEALTGTTQAEQAAAAARAAGAVDLETQEELIRRARGFEQERGGVAGPGILSRLQTPIPLGQTGLRFNPLYGLLGGAGGLALSQLMRGDEDEKKDRSLLTNPLVLALLLGGAGGVLPGMLGGGGGQPSTEGGAA